MYVKIQYQFFSKSKKRATHDLVSPNITKVKCIYYVFLRKCVCIIAAALAALPLSPEIRVHPQQNLSFETNILQSLIEWIVVPSTSAEDSLMEGI